MRSGAQRAARLRVLGLALGLPLPAPAAPVAAPACGESLSCARMPRIRAVRFEGPGARELSRLRARTGFSIDLPATEENLVRVVLALSEEPGVGGLQLKLTRTDRDHDTAELLVTADGKARRVARLLLTTSKEADPVPDESWQLLRQVQLDERPLFLTAGRPLHPYFQRLDAEALRRAWQRRGHRDAQVDVDVEVSKGADLADVTFRIATGPRYTVSSVTLVGAAPSGTARDKAVPLEMENGALARLQEGLRTRAGEDATLVPQALDQDAEAIRADFCARGFAQTKVAVRQVVRENAGAVARTEVAFEVSPGGRSTLAAVVIEGFALPESARAALPVQANGPYCPDQLQTLETAVLAWLKDHGHPDALVDVSAQIVDTPPHGPKRVRARVRITANSEARLTRIWFEGNWNTREDVVRQLLSVAEGDLYRESEVQTSVQNLLRSGLFKRAEVQSISGARKGERYLIFTVTEGDPISIDLVEQSLTLRNLDATDGPEGFDDLAAGGAFRGAGHELRLLAREDEIGVRFENLFLHRYLLTEVELAWRSLGVGPVDEQWGEVNLGLGVKFLENRFALVPFVAVALADLPHRTVLDVLPIRQGQTLDVSAGAVVRLDVNLRDDERLPYLGVDARVKYERSLPILGSDLETQVVDAEAGLNLPLGTNSVGAHYVLHLAGRYGRRFSNGPVTAHQRLRPRIRGYTRDALGVPFDAETSDDDGTLGGDRVATATTEIRIPIRPLRRNAFVPFVDAAAVASEGTPLLDRPYVAAGAAYVFSFFSERLEGFVYGAVPFDSDADWKPFGAGVGGNF